VTSDVLEANVDFLVLTVDVDLGLLHVAHAHAATLEPGVALLLGTRFATLLREAAALAPLPNVVECESSKTSHSNIEEESVHRLIRLVDVGDRNEVIGLFAHLALLDVQLGKEGLLRAQHHVEFLAIDHLNLSTVVEDLTVAVLRDFDLLDTVLQQVVVQEVHVDEFLHRRLVVHNEVERSSSRKSSNPAFRLGVTSIRLEEEALSLLFPGGLLVRLALFLILLGTLG